jgi:chemotaxis protein MotB
MARHKKHPEHENLERWLVSYADFITLLFATFTALYAIATSKLTDSTGAAQEIKKSFQQETLLKGISSILTGQSTPTDKPNPMFEETGKGEGVIGQFDSLTLTQGEKKALEDLMEELDEVANDIAEKLKDAMGAENLSPALGLKEQVDGREGVPLRGLEVTLQERGLKISFDSRLLFPSGEANLNPKSLRFVDEIASRLLKSVPTHLIHIEGHTDNTAIFGRYPSNWELSSARACTVVRYFIDHHKFTPSDLVAVGYADSRPVTSNSTPSNRAKNRRIDIILHSRAGENHSDPIRQHRKEKILIDQNHRFSIENKRAKDTPVDITPVLKADIAPVEPPTEASTSTPMKQKASKPIKNTIKTSQAPLVETMKPIEEQHLPIFDENGQIVNAEKVKKSKPQNAQK